MLPTDDAAALLACIEAEQLRIRELLSGREESTLAARPANDKWSVVENLRHLVFAEQLHFRRFVTRGRQWNPIGLPPQSMRDQKRLRMVGSTDSSAGEVLEAWQEVHGSTRELVQEDTAEVRKALERNLRHLRAHVNVVERLLRPP